MGTNTFVTKAEGEIIEPEDPNQYKTGLSEDLVPRNVNGVPTNEGADLGDAVYRWDDVRAKNAILDTATVGTVNTPNIQATTPLVVNSTSTTKLSGNTVTLEPSAGGNLIVSNGLNFSGTSNADVNLNAAGTGIANIGCSTGALTLTRNTRTGFYCNSSETGIRNTNATPATGFRCNNEQAFIEAEGTTRVTVTASTMTLNPSLWFLAQDIYDSTVGFSGNVNVDSTGRLRRFSSSRKIKKNIMDLKENNVLDLRPVTFDSKTDENSKNIIGLIAEEVDEIDPRLVPKNPKTGECEGVNYTAIGVMLIPIVKELTEKVEKLEARIKDIEGRK